MKKAYTIICVALALVLVFSLWGLHYLRNNYRSPLSAQVLPVSDKIYAMDINTADKDELCCLPGIGEALAQRIIDYRSEYGGFTSMDQLLEVKGIGGQTYEKIKPYLTIGGSK